MWVSTARFEALEYKIRELEASIKGPAGLTQRVSDLESQTMPLRIGDPPSAFFYGAGDWDTRPKVSIRESVRLVMEHLKLKLTKTKAVPERIELEKVKA